MAPAYNFCLVMSAKCIIIILANFPSNKLMLDYFHFDKKFNVKFLNDLIPFQISKLSTSAEMYFLIPFLQFNELKVWPKNIFRIWQDPE
jgi:hypothetical protein